MTVICSGKARGAKVEMYHAMSKNGRCLETFLVDRGLYA